LTSWPATALRWLGRRPARTATALLLGALAIAFGTEVATFTATFRTAKQADARAAFGADLRLELATDVPQALPDLGPEVVATTPLRYVPSRAGSDRTTILAVDVGTYGAAATSSPQIVRGRGLDALATDPKGVIVAQEIASLFAVTPGDTLPVTIFPDDLDLSRKLDLHVVGVFRAFPPTDPLSEMVMSSAAIPTPVPAPDIYLARIAPKHDPARVARDLRRAIGTTFSVSTIDQSVRKQQRSLTALSLDGLSRIESTGAGLIAAVGVGVLGAFLVLERRRELAVLRTVGADTAQVVTGPGLECAFAAVGSIVIGVPIGLGLGVLAVRVLGLFFTLPPPLVTIPVGALGALAVAVVVMSAIAIGIALRRAARLEVAQVLREP
jgi:putative ABC transport system permease protein